MHENGCINDIAYDVLSLGDTTMLTRKLALSVATAALLTTSALPAMAVPFLTFDFSTVVNSAVNGGSLSNTQRLLKGTFGTNNAGLLTSFTGTFGGSPIVLNSVSGTYAPVTTPPTGTEKLASLALNYNTPSGPNPFVTAFLKYDLAGVPFVTTYDDNLSGGTSPAVITPKLVPEIDGGVLPKGLFVIAGMFLMLFGRNKAFEA